MFRRRVVLAGDAAHAGPPNMTEGGCMALEDSSVLAKVLRSEDSVNLALEAYVRGRMPRAKWVQEQSSAAGKAWFLPPAKRNAVMRDMGDQLFRDLYEPLRSTP
jgi:2-polyprenyl-6-methoxyphenol hydroxylase-like FAD-dependent oxidoreductase